MASRTPPLPKPARNGRQAALVAQPEVRPMRVSGVIVAKSDLIEALRFYAPTLSDIQVTEDGETFCLTLAHGAPTHTDIHTDIHKGETYAAAPAP